MTDPLDDLAAIDKVIALVADESVRFLAELDSSPALPRGAAEAAERFGGRGQKVIEMPFDGHFRPGGVIDVQNEINRRTRRQLLELAAACAEHFTATADRPRRERR